MNAKNENEKYISFKEKFTGLEDGNFFYNRVFSIKSNSNVFINTDFKGSIKNLKKIELPDMRILFD